MDLEEWRPVPGYEGLYEVSSLGRVKSVARTIVIERKGNYRPGTYSRLIKERILVLSHHSGKFPYPTVVLSKNGVTVQFTVHRLVAAAFLPNPDNLPVIDHIDNDCTNNSVSNLRWLTQSKNIQRSYDQGRHTRSPKVETSASMRPVYCYETDKTYKSCTDAAKQLGLGHDFIQSCVKRKGKLLRCSQISNGKMYHVAYAEDKEDLILHIQQSNALHTVPFMYGRHAVDLATGKVYLSSKELREEFNISSSTTSTKFYSQYRGYLPKYGCFLYDIGYRLNNYLDNDEMQKLMNEMKCAFVRHSGYNVVRCTTTGKLYRSAQDAERCLGLPNASVRERLAKYGGRYQKYNLCFEEVHASQLSDEECIEISESLAESCKTRSGPFSRKVTS